MAAASFNKKTATNEIQQNKKVTNLAYQKGSHTQMDLHHSKQDVIITTYKYIF